MRRGMFYPVLTAGFLIMWLLLNEGGGLGAAILGAILSIAASRALGLLNPRKVYLQRPRIAAKLSLVVLVEIIRSNAAVVRIILDTGARARTSGFVRIPLEMRDPYGLAALACIITATPGTVWVDYDARSSVMLLHVLDLIDEEQWVRIIKDRYEGPLMELIKCQSSS